MVFFRSKPCLYNTLANRCKGDVTHGSTYSDIMSQSNERRGRPLVDLFSSFLEVLDTSVLIRLTASVDVNVSSQKRAEELHKKVLFPKTSFVDIPSCSNCSNIHATPSIPRFAAKTKEKLSRVRRLMNISLFILLPIKIILLESVALNSFSSFT